MGNFEVSGNYEGYVYVGHASGRFDAEENGQPVKREYHNIYVLSPVSNYTSEDYKAYGFKAEKLKCATPTVWDGLQPGDRVKLFFDERKRVIMTAYDDQ